MIKEDNIVLQEVTTSISTNSNLISTSTTTFTAI